MSTPGRPKRESFDRQREGSPVSTPDVHLEPDASLITLTHVTYALHALGLAIGAFGASTVIGAFVFGWPSIVAVIVNYIKRGDARGTWLESHFSWQIRTFWYALLWVLVAGLAFLTVIGIPVSLLMILILGLWAIYRIARGWLRLRDRMAMP